MFNPEQWVHCENITVKQFIEYLQKYVPEDAVFFVCGDSQAYMPMESDGSVFSVDDCSLSDLEEYEDCEFRELKVKRDEYRGGKNNKFPQGSCQCIVNNE